MTEITNDEYRPAIQSPGEEVANGITHGLGFGLSCAGIVLMIVFSSLRGDAWHIVACSIFGASLILLYATSTVYHAVQIARAKRVLRILDHISIYILIAGTYTAVTLTFLRGPLGWTLFGLEWGIAILGICFKSIFQHKWDFVATIGYVVMGWLIIIASYPMLTSFPKGGLMWLVLGGIAYTGGVPFYLQDDKKKYFHAIWHLFVLAGSICHFFMVLWYIIPRKG